MKVLVLGASGATGRQVVRQLIKREISSRIIVRHSSVLPDDMENTSFLEIIRGSINEFSDMQMSQALRDCDAVVSCLGHNISFKGMYGHPRDLVSDSVKSVCRAIRQKDDRRVKFILMSTTAYTNSSIGEKNRVGEKMILSLLNLLLPPHRDNMKSANYLVHEIGLEDEQIEWIAVRPDSLINSEKESPYNLQVSPVRSPIFNAGKTSRINVAHFMAELLTDKSLWQTWQCKAPVIYNNLIQ